MFFFFFFFIDTATTEIYTLSLHDVFRSLSNLVRMHDPHNLLKKYLRLKNQALNYFPGSRFVRSEEHTSELQSRFDLVCRLLLEKKKIQTQQQLLIAHAD